MVSAIDARSRKVAVGLMLAALLTLGTLAGPASAQGRGNDNRDRHHQLERRVLSCPTHHLWLAIWPEILWLAVL